MVLNFGQVILIFMIEIGFFGSIIAIFILEWIHKWVMTRKITQAVVKEIEERKESVWREIDTRRQSVWGLLAPPEESPEGSRKDSAMPYGYGPSSSSDRKVSFKQQRHRRQSIGQSFGFPKRNFEDYSREGEDGYNTQYGFDTQY